jgi:hypothetical protein
VDRERADGLFVVREGDARLARGEVPETSDVCMSMYTGKARNKRKGRVGEVQEARGKADETHRTVESMLPVMTCGSDSWHLTSATVAVWPERTWICALVRMSHTRAEASRPAVTSTSSVG